MSSNNKHKEAHGGHLAALALGALGVVYGDIGTSPLYAFRECFSGPHGIPVNPANIYGVLSLMVWSLILMVTVKYMLYVLRADNRGEGGIMALTALACPRQIREKKSFLLILGLFGASLLYGDGIITPAISVLSAVEGLEVATPAFQPFIIPITISLLVMLFFAQKFGTGKIGSIFGPIILVWFSTLGILGLRSAIDHPAVFSSFNPMYAIDFFLINKWHGFVVLGAIFLTITGGEALYADMGHFGRKPIQIAWFCVVMPGLLLNYFGQGALLLTNPAAAINPFYLLAPNWALYPLVGLSTMATVVASQAVISGVFSLTRQAIQMGYLPRLQVVHTSSEEIGQIYMPQVNWTLLFACCFLVIEFKSSSALAALYGTAISTDMIITTLFMFVITTRLWKWPMALSLGLTGFFLIIDFAFWGANATKIPQGGWIPFALAGANYLLMSTWQKGRSILGSRLRSKSIPLVKFLKDMEASNITRVPGTAMFMYGDPTGTPPALYHNARHNKVIHEKLVILTVLTEEVPSVSKEDRVQVTQTHENLIRAVAHYGFMESPNIEEILNAMKAKGTDLPLKEITFFLGRETLMASTDPQMPVWREKIFAFMSTNAQRATAFFRIPADQVIEVGMQVEI